jgi:hypothetical protein
MTVVQSPTRKSILYSLFPVFPRFFASKSTDPTPLPCGKPLFGPSIACKIREINILHFGNVNE